jgi:putative PIN family toxin of toxin-antitoxin system
MLFVARGEAGPAVRIVLDTNVILSALLWRGVPYRLLEFIRQHDDTELFTSTVLLEELAEVLVRPYPTKRLEVIGYSARQVLSDYIDAVELVTPVDIPSVVSADSDDDHVIAAAVDAAVDLIVSGDRHLLTMKSYRGIRIVTPAEALSIVAA